MRFLSKSISVAEIGAILLGVSSAAFAAPDDERRIALVIGNAAYQHVRPLANTRNDADDIAEKLEDLNFQVIKLIDADVRQHRDAIHRFQQAFGKADVGLFYYAGHGIAINGVNYLLPVDARMASAGAVGNELVRVDAVIEEVGSASGKLLVFLDACRNNPFIEKAKAIGVDGVGRGLTVSRKLESTTPKGLSRLETGTQNLYVAFATAPGTIADDGVGQRNSPFTAALLEHLDTQEEIRLVLTKVRETVLRSTNYKQTPWEQSSLIDPVFLAGEPKVAGGKRRLFGSF